MRTFTGILALTLCLRGQATLPETPAGKVFDAWLQAFNSGDRAKVAAYLDKYEPNDKGQIDMILQDRTQSGGLEVLKVESSAPLRLELLMKERTRGNHLRVNFQLVDSAALEVKSIELRPMPPPARQGARNDAPRAARLATHEAALKALDEKASELAAKDEFSGSVLVAVNGDVRLEKAYGKADRDRNQPNTIDTRFRIGSMNKMFTATAILQLVGQGKIDLSAPVGKYLKGYLNADVANKVTVRHLLTHTGGTGDIFTPEYEKRRREIRDTKDYIGLYGSRGLEFEPGSDWAYSNYGFILLGAIVESVSGVSYYDYVRKHIFEPAGMKSTDSLPESEIATKVSKGYIRGENGWTGNAERLPVRGTSAGGGYSTVRDLHRFAEALLAGKLVKPELVEQMTSKQAADSRMPPGAGYGFGMMVSGNPRRFGHGGGAPGMNGELRIHPDSKTIVVVLANIDPPSATELALYYGRIMPAQ